MKQVINHTLLQSNDKGDGQTALMRRLTYAFCSSLDTRPSDIKVCCFLVVDIYLTKYIKASTREIWLLPHMRKCHAAYKVV